MQRFASVMPRLLPLAVAIFILLGGLPAVAQESSAPRFLTIAGHGHSQADTTLAEITLGLIGKGNSTKTTYEQLTKRTAALTKMFQSRQAKAVNLSNIHLNLKDGRDGKPQKNEYEAYQTIEFRVAADNIGVLDDAIAADIDRIQRIRYVAAEQDLSAARDKAIKAAIADAQAQANVALGQLGFSPQDIVDIQVNDVITQAPGDNAPPKADSYVSWSADTPTLATGQQGVDVTVTLKVRY